MNVWKKNVSHENSSNKYIVTGILWILMIVHCNTIYFFLQVSKLSIRLMEILYQFL